MQLLLSGWRHSWITELWIERKAPWWPAWPWPGPRPSWGTSWRGERRDSTVSQGLRRWWHREKAETQDANNAYTEPITVLCNQRNGRENTNSNQWLGLSDSRVWRNYNCLRCVALMTRVKTMALIRNAIEEEIRESMDDGEASLLFSGWLWQGLSWSFSVENWMTKRIISAVTAKFDYWPQWLARLPGLAAVRQWLARYNWEQGERFRDFSTNKRQLSGVKSPHHKMCVNRFKKLENVTLLRFGRSWKIML